MSARSICGSGRKHTRRSAILNRFPTNLPHTPFEKGLSMASPAVDFARQNQQRFLSELKDLLRIPSISTAPEHKSDVRRSSEHRSGERRVGGEWSARLTPSDWHQMI